MNMFMRRFFFHQNQIKIKIVFTICTHRYVNVDEFSICNKLLSICYGYLYHQMFSIDLPL